MKRACRRFAGLLWSLLRELSDEGAYERHLAAHGKAHTATEWKSFCELRLRAKYARAKCC